MNRHVLSARIWIRGTVLAIRHPRLLLGDRAAESAQQAAARKPLTSRSY
jgi:hypothetical protein